REDPDPRDGANAVRAGHELEDPFPGRKAPSVHSGGEQKRKPGTDQDANSPPMPFSNEPPPDHCRGDKAQAKAPLPLHPQGRERSPPPRPTREARFRAPCRHTPVTREAFPPLPRIGESRRPAPLRGTEDRGG